MPDPADWRVARSIFVAEEDATARRYALDPEGAYGYYYWNLMTKRRRGNALGAFKEDPEMPDSECTLDYVLERLVLWGSV